VRRDDPPEPDEQQLNLDAIEARLSRYETVTRAILISMTVLSLLMLALILGLFFDYLLSEDQL
jgi:hypothetical protein